jgi:hypothetical protein
LAMEGVIVHQQHVEHRQLRPSSPMRLSGIIVTRREGAHITQMAYFLRLLAVC